MTQHAGLDEDRWARFTLDQQILMIGNEMNRLLHVPDGDDDGLRRGYERVLRLTDLTARGNVRPTFRRELLRWRGIIAAQYATGQHEREAQRGAFRALLWLSPATAEQIPHLLG